MGILERINQEYEKEGKKVLLDEEENKGVNLSLALIFSIGGSVISIAILVCLILAFSYDLCIFLDNYYYYIAAVIGILLVISIYYSLSSFKQKVTFAGIFNIIISLIAIVLIIIPFLTELIYF